VFLTSGVAIKSIGVAELSKVITDRGDKPTGNKAEKLKMLTYIVELEHGDHIFYGALPDGHQIRKLTVPLSA
jgi:hypothetical protein